MLYLGYILNVVFKTECKLQHTTSTPRKEPTLKPVGTPPYATSFHALFLC